jgi:hypothetical protein
MSDETFEGFVPPTKNYFPMPNNWIDICAQINSLAELKVVQYVLRHTWGYREYGIKKVITTDEFMQGRKRADGTRIDKGTGLSNRSVIDGLRAAVSHGYLEFALDETDKARKAKSYALKMQPDVKNVHIPDVKKLHSKDTNSDVKNVHSSYEETAHQGEDTSYQREDTSHRSEKDTIEKHLEKDTLERQYDASASPTHVFLAPVIDFKEATNGKLKIVRLDIDTSSQLPIATGAIGNDDDEDDDTLELPAVKIGAQHDLDGNLADSSLPARRDSGGNHDAVYRQAQLVKKGASNDSLLPPGVPIVPGPLSAAHAGAGEKIATKGGLVNDRHSQRDSTDIPDAFHTDDVGALRDSTDPGQGGQVDEPGRTGDLPDHLDTGRAPADAALPDSNPLGKDSTLFEQTPGAAPLPLAVSGAGSQADSHGDARAQAPDDGSIATSPPPLGTSRAKVDSSASQASGQKVIPKRPRKALVVVGKAGPPQMPPDTDEWGTRTCLALFDYYRGAPLLDMSQIKHANHCAKEMSQYYTRVQVVLVRTAMNNQKYWKERGGADVCDVAHHIAKELNKLKMPTLAAAVNGHQPDADMVEWQGRWMTVEEADTLGFNGGFGEYL